MFILYWIKLLFFKLIEFIFDLSVKINCGSYWVRMTLIENKIIEILIDWTFIDSHRQDIHRPSNI